MRMRILSDTADVSNENVKYVKNERNERNTLFQPSGICSSLIQPAYIRGMLLM
jgi:hypothetical protein